MEFRILGPLEVRGDDGRPLKLGGQKPRGILALLLCRPNEVISTNSLIDELWGSRPPKTAANMLQVYVSRLRKQLSAEVLVTTPPGYLLHIEPETLDAACFEQLAEEGRRALETDDPDRAAETLREALALWRGPAMADFTFESFAQAEIARLTDLRAAALEDRIEADLALARHCALVGELEALIEQYPLRSRLIGQLMLALYRSGRDAEALEAYRRTRSRLVEELGLDPSNALRDLERAILRQDPALDVRATKPTAMAREVRKTVTVLSLDMTTPGGTPDPEVVTRIALGVQETVGRAVARHHGVVHARSGGRVTAVFGTPTAHEDDALRAARTALEIRAALADEEASAGARLEVRAGIESGTVLAAEAPDAPTGIVGNVIDAASHLSQTALPGDILVGEGVEPLLDGVARLESIQLGRRRDDRPAWMLLELTSDSAIPRRLDAPLVGREEELERLLEAFEHTVRSRTPRLVTLLGPPGIGKSRLAAELRTAVANRARVVVGRCLPYGDGITFWPLREVVNQLLGEKPGQTLAGFLADDEDADRIAERLAGLTGATQWRGAGREETFWAVRRLLERLGRDRPLVVIFEDCHWAEPTFLNLVEATIGSARDTSLLVVVLARPELLDERPSWTGGMQESLFLEPLSPSASKALMVSLVGSRSLPDKMRERITEAAEGNPLFIEQMLAMLSEDVDDDQLRVPPTIQALLAARLDRVPRAERDLLEAASVIGKEFWRNAAAELLPEVDRPELPARLRSLVGTNLVAGAESIFPGDDAFRFRHVLIRDAVYEAMPKTRRAELHERFAGWLERSAADRILEFEEILGYHLEQAFRYRSELGPPTERAGDLPLRAGTRLASAGRRAYARGDMPGAVNLLGRAGSLLPERDATRLDALTLLAGGLRELGDLGRAASVLEECVMLSTAAGERALEWRARLAQLRLNVGTQSVLTTDEERATAEEAVAVFSELGDEGGLAKALLAFAWPLWVHCRAAQVEEAIRPAIEYARRAGDDATYAWTVHNYLGAGLLGPSPIREAIHRCEEVLARPSEALRIKASALRTLAVLRAMQGDFAEARRLIEDDRALLGELGLRMTAAHASEAYGLVELLAGDTLAAEREFRLGVDALGEIGERSATSIMAALLARAAYENGPLAEALRASQLSEDAALPDDISAQVQWRGPRAKVLARRGRKRKAEELAREAVTLAADTDFLTMHGDALLDLAEVLRLLGRGTEAAPYVEQAVHLHRRKGNAVSAARAEGQLRSLGQVGQKRVVAG